MLSDLITIYIFDDEGEIIDDTYNIPLCPKSGISEMKVEIDEEKILNEINKILLILIQNEAFSV